MRPLAHAHFTYATDVQRVGRRCGRAKVHEVRAVGGRVTRNAGSRAAGAHEGLTIRENKRTMGSGWNGVKRTRAPGPMRYICRACSKRANSAKVGQLPGRQWPREVVPSNLPGDRTEACGGVRDGIRIPRAAPAPRRIGTHELTPQAIRERPRPGTFRPLADRAACPERVRGGATYHCSSPRHRRSS